MADAQLLKGVFEMAVLGIVAKGETYGYEILMTLKDKGFLQVGEGTLYPVLTRLDTQGLITCRKGHSPLGPIRKYYTITDEGVKRLQLFQIEFEQLFNQVMAILKEDI